jgi:hypothetical protein
VPATFLSYLKGLSGTACWGPGPAHNTLTIPAIVPGGGAGTEELPSQRYDGLSVGT